MSGISAERRPPTVAPLVACVVLSMRPVAPAEVPPADTARAVAEAAVKESGVTGGFAVCVEPEDAALLYGLQETGNFLLLGLYRSEERCAAARAILCAKGRTGRIYLDTWNGCGLPLRAGTVNVLIVNRMEKLAQSEILRPLVPGGVAFVAARRGRLKLRGAKQLVLEGRSCLVLRKGHCPLRDSWAHFLHGPDNNPVAQDQKVGPPRALQWISGPLWSRSHEFLSSTAVAVTAGGRLYVVQDLGLTSLTKPPVAERWTLIVRDAYNGVLLWKRPLPGWGTKAWRRSALRAIPPDAQRLVVADSQQVFLPLEFGGPLYALNGRTGKVKGCFSETNGARELRLSDSTLVVRCGKDRLLAVNAEEGRLLWTIQEAVHPGSLAVSSGGLVYLSGRYLVRRDLASGKEKWRVGAEKGTSLVVASPRAAVAAGKGKLTAYAIADGHRLWSEKVKAGRSGLFIVEGRLWHWEGKFLTGRELLTGRVRSRIDPSSVMTPGHHFRCYPDKATVRYIVTANRGAEFVSLTGKGHCQNDWVRGACRYGVLPANGLLYVPPHPCMCNPGVMLTGFLALAPACEEPSSEQAQARLFRGPVYGEVALGPEENADSWPLYRHDARRTGASPSPVASQLTQLWSVQLISPLTSCVATSEQVFVASKRGVLAALSTESGALLWKVALPGPVDSPPSVYRGLVICGCGDGRVWCFRATDGACAWHFQAAPQDLRIVAFEQITSVWPVSGSVLVAHDRVYVCAGRSTFLDGGLYLYGLDPLTGKVLCRQRIDTYSALRRDTEKAPVIPAYHMEGARADLLVSEGGFLYLGQYKFDRDLRLQPVPYRKPEEGSVPVTLDLRDKPYAAADADPSHDYEAHQRQWLERTQKGLLAALRRQWGWYSLGQRYMGRHLMTTGGFLDDSYFNRSFWMYASFWPGYYLAHRAPKTGQLLVIGPQQTYAFQAFPSRNLQSPLFEPGLRGYLLVTDRNDNEPVLNRRTWGTTKGWGYTRREPPAWYQWIRLRVRAAALAGTKLLLAGVPDVLDPRDPMASFEGRLGGLLQVRSSQDGSLVSSMTLPAPPVFDGMAVSHGRVYLALTSGELLCLR